MNQRATFSTPNVLADLVKAADWENVMEYLRNVDRSKLGLEAARAGFVVSFKYTEDVENVIANLYDQLDKRKNSPINKLVWPKYVELVASELRKVKTATEDVALAYIAKFERKTIHSWTQGWSPERAAAFLIRH